MNKIKVGILSLCLCGTLASAQTLEWTSGQLGGSWFSMSAGIAKIIETENPKLKIKVVPGGGVTNPSKIQKGKSQVGVSIAPLAHMAELGKDVYNNKPHSDLMMIGGSIMDIKFQVVKAADAKYSNIEEVLKAKDVKIGVTKVGSSDEKIFSWIMQYYNTSYKALKDKGFKITFANVNELASQYKDGMIDYVVINTGAPNAGIMDMLLSRDGTITELPENLRKELANKYSLMETKIPKGTYKGQEKGSLTANSATVILASKKLSVDTVYSMTKAICENQSKLPDIHKSMVVFDCKTATVGNPVPVHPGAIKYYKEMGYIK